MKHGEIVEEGTHEELLAKEGLYYGLVNAQVFVDYDEGTSSILPNFPVQNSLKPSVIQDLSALKALGTNSP